MSTQKEETRRRLLEVARKLLLKKGFHGAGLDDIAEAAGISRQAVYKSHFASKAELLLELVRYVHVAENLDELVAPVHAATSGLEKLKETIRTIVLIETKIHDLAMVLSSAASSDAGAKAAWRDRLEVKRGALRAALEATKREDHLAPTWKVEEALDLLSMLVSVDSYEQLVVQDGWKPEQMIERIWQLCEGSVLRPRSQAKATPKSRRPRQ